MNLQLVCLLGLPIPTPVFLQALSRVGVLDPQITFTDKDQKIRDLCIWFLPGVARPPEGLIDLVVPWLDSESPENWEKMAHQIRTEFPQLWIAPPGIQWFRDNCPFCQDVLGYFPTEHVKYAAVTRLAEDHWVYPTGPAQAPTAWAFLTPPEPVPSPESELPVWGPKLTKKRRDLLALLPKEDWISIGALTRALFGVDNSFQRDVVRSILTILRGMGYAEKAAGSSYRRTRLKEPSEEPPEQEDPKPGPPLTPFRLRLLSHLHGGGLPATALAQLQYGGASLAQIRAARTNLGTLMNLGYVQRSGMDYVQTELQPPPRVP